MLWDAVQYDPGNPQRWVSPDTMHKALMLAATLVAGEPVDPASLADNLGMKRQIVYPTLTQTFEEFMQGVTDALKGNGDAPS